jgi:hypothetical protein
MSLIAKRDVDCLLAGGFSEEELGLVEGGICGVEVYESPENYFAHELIENACEAGECSLWDEIIPPAPVESYDRSRKSVWNGQEYAGNDDWLEGVPVNLRDQAIFVQTIKCGKMTVWQRRNPKTGAFEWPVKNLRIEIGDEDKERYSKMSKEYQKDLWIAYAKCEWKNLWVHTVDSLMSEPIEDTIEFTAKNGTDLNLLVIPADNVRKMGYTNLPSEARWITMVYFYKDEND